MGEHDHGHRGGHGRGAAPSGGGGGHEEGGGESAPLWVISFADLSTLLMSFFVLMMASTPKGQTSQDEDAELLKVLASVKAAFRYVPLSGSQDRLDREVFKVLSQKQDNDSSGAGAKTSRGAGIRGISPSVSELWNKAQASIGEPIPFAHRSAELPPDWLWLIEEVAEVVREHYRIIIIRGHCSQDEGKEEQDGGFQLAYQRALAVKQALIDLGISPSRFRLVSCGPYESVVLDGKIQEAQASDRRAEITLGAYFMPAYESLKEMFGSDPLADAP
jgi:chemotaxis protein MotB